MTPAQRKYDIDLATNMRAMATWIEPRSSKVAQALLLGAQRIEALTVAVSIDPGPVEIQPASTPVQPNR